MVGSLIVYPFQLCRAVFEYLFSMFSPRIYFSKSKRSVAYDERPFSEGAYSSVHKGYDLSSRSTKYALKRIIIQSKEADLDVKNEIESLLKFGVLSRKILRLYDYQYVENRNNGGSIVFLLFPLMEKGTLRKYLDSVLNGEVSKRPNMTEIVRSFASIVSAVDVLHNFEPPHVHADIKPENILCGENNDFYLTDLGSVRKAEIKVTSRKGAVMIIEDAATKTTMPYRAPELFDPPLDSTLDSRTDIWSLGCLLFAWRYGYSPFECCFISGDLAPKVTQSSHSSSLGKIPRPSKPTADDIILLDAVEWILQKHWSERPFSKQLLSRLDAIINRENSCV